MVRVASRGPQAAQDLLLRVGVDRGERVVQDQDARLGRQGPREGRALLLPARQGQAALADEGVVAAREVGDVLRELRDVRGRLHAPLHLVRRHRRGQAERHVLAHGGREQERLLRDEADGLAQLVERQQADVDAVHEDGPGGGSKSRGSRLASVLLPEPVAPTIATVDPAGTFRLTSRSTGRSGS